MACHDLVFNRVLTPGRNVAQHGRERLGFDDRPIVRRQSDRQGRAGGFDASRGNGTSDQKREGRALSATKHTHPLVLWLLSGKPYVVRLPRGGVQTLEQSDWRLGDGVDRFD